MIDRYGRSLRHAEYERSACPGTLCLRRSHAHEESIRFDFAGFDGSAISFPLRAQTMAEKYPPRAEDLRPTSGWAPPFRRPVEAAVRERVPLRVGWADNELSEGVVTSGVPFARGAKADVRNLRVIDDAA